MTDDLLFGAIIIMITYNTLLTILKLVILFIFLSIEVSPFYLYYYYGHIWIDELFGAKRIDKVIQTLIFFKRFIFISVYSLLIVFFSVEYGKDIISYCLDDSSYIGLNSIRVGFLK